MVNLLQMVTVDKRDLTDLIGALSSKRVREILEGVLLVLQPRDLEPELGERTCDSDAVSAATDRIGLSPRSRTDSPATRSRCPVM